MVEAVVVDDSQFMRVQIRKILQAGGITVVATAHNGKAGVEAVQENQPDVVTMDVKMPGMDGIEAVRRIMAVQPTPILMLSRYTDRENDTSFEALDAGAVDVYPKPGDEVSTELVKYADELVDAVEAVADASLPDVPEEVNESETTADERTAETATADDKMTDVAHREGAVEGPLPTLVLAASTGGPPVVQSILESLPTGVGLRGIVVQHMPEQFTDRYARRLDVHSTFNVREADASDTLGTDEFVVAKGGQHLVAAADDGTSLDLERTADPPRHSVRPAADLTLETVAETVKGKLVAAVLTGMGRDGAAGVEHISAAGGTTIAQDPASANIASMPEYAIETGAIDRVLPAEDIPAAILDAIE